MRSRDCGSTPTVGSSSRRTRGSWIVPGGDVQPALHAARELVRLVVGAVGQADPVEARAGSRRPARRRASALVAAERPEVLARREQGIEGDLLRHPPPQGRARGRRPARTRGSGGVPPSGRTRPATLRTSVVLPAPLGPSRPRISPGARSSETPSSARRAPKDFERLRTSRGDAAAIGGNPMPIDPLWRAPSWVNLRRLPMSSLTVRSSRRGGKPRHAAVVLAGALARGVRGGRLRGAGPPRRRGGAARRRAAADRRDSVCRRPGGRAAGDPRALARLGVRRARDAALLPRLLLRAVRAPFVRRVPEAEEPEPLPGT